MIRGGNAREKREKKVYKRGDRLSFRLPIKEKYDDQVIYLINEANKQDMLNSQIVHALEFFCRYKNMEPLLLEIFNSIKSKGYEDITSVVRESLDRAVINTKTVKLENSELVEDNEPALHKDIEQKYNIEEVSEIEVADNKELNTVDSIKENHSENLYLDEKASLEMRNSSQEKVEELSNVQLVDKSRNQEISINKNEIKDIKTETNGNNNNIIKKKKPLARALSSIKK